MNKCRRRQQRAGRSRLVSLNRLVELGLIDRIGRRSATAPVKNEVLLLLVLLSLVRRIELHRVRDRLRFDSQRAVGRSLGLLRPIVGVTQDADRTEQRAEVGADDLEDLGRIDRAIVAELFNVLRWCQRDPLVVMETAPHRLSA